MIAALFFSAAASAGPAVESRFQNVALLTTTDRVSVVFELTSEPRNVATRRVSAAVLELEAEPVIAPAAVTSFTAPRGVRFVSGVSIQSAAGSNPGLLKARILLLERARSAVRIVGRRVYVDFWPDSATVPALPERYVLPAPAPTPAAPVPASPQRPLPQPSVPSRDDAYRAAIKPAIEQFDKLAPFLLSATSSPSPQVLKAVSETLKNVESVVSSVDVPGESRRGHGLLAAAVALASTSVDPDFAGDRAAQARQALSLFDQAKSGW